MIGNEVTNVYDAVVSELGPEFAKKLDSNDEVTSDSEESIPREKGLMGYVNKLIGVITGSMTPVIGVIAASGIIKGILALLTLPQLGQLLSIKSTLYITVSAMADSAFSFYQSLLDLQLRDI